jgi:hypothetical protein
VRLRSCITIVSAVCCVLGLAHFAAAAQPTRAGRQGSAFAARAVKPLTKTQYIDKYNALCDDAIVASDPIAQRIAQEASSGGVTPALLTELESQGAPIVRTRLQATHKLVPPKRDRAQVRALLAAQDRVYRVVHEDPNTLIGSALPLYNEADSLARNYGLESGVCFNLTIGRPS